MWKIKVWGHNQGYFSWFRQFTHYICTQINNMVNCCTFCLTSTTLHPRNSLQSVLVDFYQEDEILAKKFLIRCTDITKLPSAQVYTKKQVGDDKREIYWWHSEYVQCWWEWLPCTVVCVLCCLTSPCAVMQKEIEMSDISVMKSEIVQLGNKIDSVYQVLRLLNRLRESVSNTK